MLVQNRTNLMINIYLGDNNWYFCVRADIQLLMAFCDDFIFFIIQTYEPPRDKTNKVSVCPAKTQISLGIRPVWSESLLSAWRKLGPLATHWAHSEYSDQTRRMPRLIRVFAGRTFTLLVLSRGGSNGIPVFSHCEDNKRPYLKI